MLVLGVRVVSCAVQVLQLISNLSVGHLNMQLYFRVQPGHQQELNLVADIVTFLSTLERDLKDAAGDGEKKGRVPQITIDQAYAVSAHTRKLTAVQMSVHDCCI
jgi:hypothetical protein